MTYNVSSGTLNPTHTHSCTASRLTCLAPLCKTYTWRDPPLPTPSVCLYNLLWIYALSVQIAILCPTKRTNTVATRQSFLAQGHNKSYSWTQRPLPGTAAFQVNSAYTGWLKIKYPTGEYAISPQPVVWGQYGPKYSEVQPFGIIGLERVNDIRLKLLTKFVEKHIISIVNEL